ncbi:hypothetical protein [Pseudovibrio sp. JE062]|uniref:hypothetical protein n=1 Tax=Pseudovibrio sp. JE062 TaxID=439495 RepID=UPI00055F242D|nr:hypothetical protein [Pseudovibrio sp. JE062]
MFKMLLSTGVVCLGLTLPGSAMALQALQEACTEVPPNFNAYVEVLNEPDGREPNLIVGYVTLNNGEDTVDVFGLCEPHVGDIVYSCTVQGEELGAETTHFHYQILDVRDRDDPMRTKTIECE